MSYARAPAIREFITAISRRSYSTRLAPRPQLRPSPTRVLHSHGAVQHRNASFKKGFKKLMKDSPVSATLAFACIIAGAGCLLYINWFYFKFMVLHNYPEEVAKKLRRAIYYSAFDFKPDEAVRYYKEAITLARELNMDCWSDEVIGIKLAVAQLMERTEQYEKQVTALEVIRRDCVAQANKYGDDRKKDKARLMKWATAMSVKLGELYGMPEIWNRDAAEMHLSWAIETSIKERQRRNRLKITEEDEGPWISDEELGATIESLAHRYEAKDMHYLAAPLFLHAVNLHPVKTCHTVVLMNNLASSLSQQTPRAAMAMQAYTNSQSIDEGPATVPVTREMLLQMANVWAHNALDLASQITPPDRTEECDIGCAVTVHNLGELAEMAKDYEGAKKRYREAISLARAVGFSDGIENSSARLRKLEKKG